MRWTDRQLEAITRNERRILVSAAAGSGKTAVLVERILRKITNPSCPQDITRFLMVTFTKAAAAEMRGRLAKALSQRLAKADPDSEEGRLLLRQLMLLPAAQITTVHAFCMRLIRENFHALALPASFRLADEHEAGLLADEAAEAVLEEAYAKNGPGSPFFALVEAVAGPRDDRRLKELILTAHANLMSGPDPEGYRRDRLAESKNISSDAAETLWGKTYRAGICEEARYYHRAYEALCSTLAKASFPGADKLYIFMEEEAQEIADLQKAFAQGSWDETRKALLAFAKRPRFPSVRKADPLKDRAKKLRDNLKKWVNKLEVGVAAQENEQVLDDLRESLPVTEAFFDLVARFGEVFSEKKREANVLDFNDLEHMALKLLCKGNENGRLIPSDIAKSEGARFDEILVDEYQDTNGLQDTIFRCLTEEGGAALFMVGDVKQSIYRFRQADPTIFLARKNQYSRERKKGQVALFLPDNFRSAQTVLDAVNFTFFSLMSDELGEMEYSEEEHLRGGSGVSGAKAELVYLSTAEEDDTDEAGEAAEPPLSRKEAEASYAAYRIERILQEGIEVYDKGLGRNRPLEPSDIAILLRSYKGFGPLVEEALAARKIPVSTGSGRGFFDTAEVDAFLALLESIDNPTRETSLIGFLRSPLGGFTADELGKIRLALPKKQNFYEALVKVSEEDSPLGEKCASILEKLKRWRREAGDEAAGSFLGRLLNETGALLLYGAMENGEARRANLLLLLEKAAGFSGGLGALLRYFDGIYQKGIRPDGGAGGSTGGVQLLSVHKSKGLEFPVVILLGMAGRFNLQWKSEALLLHPVQGPGFRRRDQMTRIERTTLKREAVTQALQNEQLSEELRILYVAMTRARERLMLVSAYGNVEDKLSKLSALLAGRGRPDPVLLRKQPSFADWISLALLGAGEPALLVKAGQAEEIEPGQPLPFKVAFDSLPDGKEELIAESKEQTADPALVEEIRQWLTYTYPHKKAVTLPAKLTATGFKGLTMPDEEETPPISFGGDISKKTPAIPRFLSGKTSLSPTEKGTAMHLAMQLLPFTHVHSVEKIQEGLQELKERGILSSEQLAAVSPDAIGAFYETSVGKRVLKQWETKGNGGIFREFKFSLLADAARYYGSEGLTDERVLVQGVIDLFFEEDDGTLTLVDFKTDAVTGAMVDQRARSYIPQVRIYAEALAEITQKPLGRQYLYFFEDKKLVKIDWSEQDIAANQ